MVINGVFWRTRTGSPWRDVPGEYGNWKTVYNRHQRWSTHGTWTWVLDELRRGCDVGQGEWALAVDSAVVRAQGLGRIRRILSTVRRWAGPAAG
jgi:transposase